MNDLIEQLSLIEAFPHKAQYTSNEKVIINIIVDNKVDQSIFEEINIIIKVHSQVLFEEKKTFEFTTGSNKIAFEFDPPYYEVQGFGVDIYLGQNSLSTAFDIVTHWSKRPRYGFLSDFYKADEGDSRDIENMAKYHINIVQFYDWMYKHEDLISQEDYYIDLLDRKLSKISVKNKIEYCHKFSMKALAYGAIYAASKNFYTQHKEWALYTNNDEPQNLGNWFYIMNISRKSPWHKHIINEFKNVIEVLDFDGIHMDTYGFPKTAYSKVNGLKKIEKLNKQFPILIEDTRSALELVKEDVGLIFNAVGNWGIEDVAISLQDVVYIEVWDPQDKYYHLYQLVNRARELSGKQVILAAYLKCFEQKDKYTYEACQTALLLTSAVIFASGGFHFILGEENGVLADPYYVNYQKIQKGYEREIRNYYDFIVRYGNLLFSNNIIDNSMTYANGGNQEYIFYNADFSSYPQPNKVWTIIKEMPGYKIIHLINFTSIESDIWNEGKPLRPSVIENIQIRALIDESVKGVYMASPDSNQCNSCKLTYDIHSIERGNVIQFTVSQLKIWSVIYIEIEE